MFIIIMVNTSAALTLRTQVHYSVHKNSSQTLQAKAGRNEPPLCPLFAQDGLCHRLGQNYCKEKH